MMNEFIFFIFLFGGLSLALVASFFGRAFLYVFIVVLTLAVGLAEPKIIELFSSPVTMSAVFYGVIFFCTDMLSERYGTKAGYAAVRYSVFAAIVFLIITKLMLLVDGSTDVSTFSDAFAVVFGMPERIIISGIVVFAISQSFNVWIYQKIREKTEGQYLWIRNNGSTMLSQVIASFLFAFLAFYDTGQDWMSMAIATCALRIFIALCDTPFMYISTYISPRDFRQYTMQMKHWDETMIAEKELQERQKL